MGSFANSLHVKCNDADDVVDSIRTLMSESGREPTDELPDEDSSWGLSTAIRAFHVSASHRGWVGVLDSNVMEFSSLAAELSRRLETQAVLFMVNDSDSWHYVLYRHGIQVDEFDSSGGAAGEYEWGDDSPDIIPMFPTGGFEEQIQEMQQQLAHEMPDEIRDIQERINQGTVTPEELTRFGQWIEEQSQQMMDQVIPLSARPSPPKETLAPHVQKLRSILPPDVDDHQVLDLLGKQAVFAEETLAEFLQLVGIAPVFANLSYAYAQEYTMDDLASEGVKMVAHLCFTTSAGG